MSNLSDWIMILKYPNTIKKKKKGHLKEISDFMSEAGNVHFHVTENKETLNCYGHVKS